MSTTIPVVTLTGTNLTGTTAVNYTTGTGVVASNIAVVSDTSVTCTFTVASNATSGAVSVTTPAGESNTVPFTVTSVTPPPTAPTLTSISPNSAAQGSSGTFTLTGTNFTGATAVNFTTGTGVTVSALQVTSSTSATVTLTISASATSGTVSITTPAGTSGTVPFTVTTPAPTAPAITGISPPSGPTGTSVTVTGTNFGSSGTLTIGGVTVTPDSWSDTSITFTVPSGLATGNANVIVTVGGQASNSEIFAVTAAPVAGSELVVGQGTIQFGVAGNPTRQLASICGGITIPDGPFANLPGLSLFCATAWSPGIAVTVGTTTVTISGTTTAVDGTAISYDGTYTVAGITTGPDDYGLTLRA